MKTPSADWGKLRQTMAVRRWPPHTARTPRAEFGQLDLYQQQTDLTKKKLHKPAGPETSVFLIYLSLTNTSHFLHSLGKAHPQQIISLCNYSFLCWMSHVQMSLLEIGKGLLFPEEARRPATFGRNRRYLCPFASGTRVLPRITCL